MQASDGPSRSTALTAQGLIGRDEEVGRGESMLRAGLSGSVCWITAAAGMGKSALWAQLVGRAEGLGYRVFSARAADTPGDAAFDVISELLERVPADAFEDLRGPQRHAINVVLRREEPGDRPVDARAIGEGLVSVFSDAVRQAPVVIAVDDVQWCDPSSAAVLRGVFRRLEQCAVLRLFAMRTSLDGTANDPFGTAPLDAAETQIHLRRLRDEDVHAIVRARAAASGMQISRAAVERVVAESGGSPFVARYLADAVMRAGLHDLLGPLPVPTGSDDLARGRIASLPKDCLALLQTAASMNQPTVTSLAAACDLTEQACRNVIDAAASADVLVIERGRVAFAHPLLAAAARSTIGPADLRGIHLRVAAISSDIEDRARHLALGSDPPDAHVGAVLEEAAIRAAARGAPLLGASMAERALDFDPGQRRSERRLLAGRCLLEGGEPERARAMFSDVARSAVGLDRARAKVELGRLLQRHGGMARSADMLREAIRDAASAEDSDAGLDASAHLWLAVAENSMQRSHLARDLLDASIGRARDSGETRLLAQALTYRAAVGFFVGDDSPDAFLTEAASLVVSSDRLNVEMRPDIWRLRLTWYRGDPRCAAEDIETVLDSFANQGLVEEVVKLALLAVPIVRDVGEFPRLRAIAERAVALAASFSDENRFVQAHAQATAAVLAAYTGDVTHAMALIRSAHHVFTTAGYGLSMAVLAPSLAFVASSAGDAAYVVSALAPLCERIRLSGLEDPGSLTYLSDVVGALIECGSLDDAADWIDWLDVRAERFDRRLERIRVQRLRAMRSAAIGDLDAARSHGELALELVGEVDGPWERARTLLLAGQIRRRTRHRTSASEALHAARLLFDSMEMPMWVAACDDEIRRLGMTPGSDRELTPTELQVARLAAAGNSNPTIAAQLFMSRKTVEANLSRCYAKLAITSRSELEGALSRSSS